MYIIEPSHRPFHWLSLAINYCRYPSLIYKLEQPLSLFPSRSGPTGVRFTTIFDAVSGNYIISGFTQFSISSTTIVDLLVFATNTSSVGADKYYSIMRIAWKYIIASS